ncbi:hypothetical protein M5689_006629 [Euphorbia peplus]|nr:hypothetical protein M5689_006629 [Euphorbia peplus]
MKRCYCGELAELKISWRETNPARRFYGCCKYGGKSRSCRYFEWYEGDGELAPHYKSVMTGLLRNIRVKDEEEKQVQSKWSIGVCMKMIMVFVIGVICGLLL